MDLKMSPKDYPSEEDVIGLFRGRCPCKRPARTVHELEPRSRGRQSLRMVNRTAICRECHEEFHRQGASESNIQTWKEKIRDYLESIGAYETYVNWDNDG